jgi:hypothetical protein
MSENNQDKNRPSHRVAFSRIEGQDENGKAVLGPAREIGAVWPRKGKEGEGILRFDHIPEEMRTQGGGVLFIKTLDPAREEHRPPKARDHDVDRDR